MHFFTNKLDKKLSLKTKIFVVFLLILVVFLLITFVIPLKVYAEQINDYNKVETYAENIVSKEEGVSVNTIVPIYNLNNEIVRYSVNYVDFNGNDFGYVILNKHLSDKRGGNY